MLIRADRRFFDKKAAKFRRQGDEWDVSEERFEEIETALPGYASPVGAQVIEAPTMADSKAQIIEYAQAAGIELDASMTKAAMLEALGA